MDLTLGAALLALSLIGPVATTAAPTPSQAGVSRGDGVSSLQAIIARNGQRWSKLVTADPARRQEDERQAERKNWIQRHPSCFGAAVGFVGGFLIGFLPGDDAVFDDFTAAFNGAVLGGIGAGTGAILGWLGNRR